MSASQPSRAEVLGYFESLSNWGRWGEDDQLGTLNLITAEKRRTACQLVREGRLVPLGMDLDPDDPDPLGRGTELSLHPTSYHIGRAEAARETVTLVSHGSPTHIDSPSHMAFDGHWYNGFSARDRIASGGPARLGVDSARGGIATRGVLLDIAGSRGVDWLDDGDGIFPEDLDAAEARQGVRVESGDVLIARTGYLERCRAQPGVGNPNAALGYHASCLPWLRERDVSVIASDALNDMNPSGYGTSEPATPDDYGSLPPDVASLLYPVHCVALVAMGAWLIDNVWVADLRATCEELGRWCFFLCMEPLRLKGSTGSPVNPLAMF